MVSEFGRTSYEKVSDVVRLQQLNINLHSRDNILTLQSLVHKINCRLHGTYVYFNTRGFVLDIFQHDQSTFQIQWSFVFIS